MIVILIFGCIEIIEKVTEERVKVTAIKMSVLRRGLARKVLGSLLWGVKTPQKVPLEFM